MDSKIRARAHELELAYRQYDPATAVNRMAVTIANLEAELAEQTRERDQLATIANLEAELAKRTRERDQLAKAIEDEYAGTSLGGKPALEIT